LDANQIAILLACPWCGSGRGQWSGRWRCCMACGCSWLYTYEVDQVMVAR